MPYSSHKHGQAEYYHYIQIPSADFEAIPQGSGIAPTLGENFAELVYIVGGSLSSAPVTVDTSTLEAIMSAVSGDTATIVTQLNAISGDTASTVSILDVISGDTATIISQLNAISGDTATIAEANRNYSSAVRTSGTAPIYTWVMKALPGSSFNDTVWQIKQIYDDTSGNVDIQWPSGDTSFSYAASAYTTLTYSY